MELYQVLTALLLSLLYHADIALSYNDVLEKYDMYKIKRIETKLDDLMTTVKELTGEITSLKKINKKLFKSLSLKGVVSDKVFGKRGKIDFKADSRSVLTGPIESSHLTKRCPGVFELSSHSSCYHIEAERVTWAEAQTMCSAIGSDLLAVETQSEQNYIVEHLKKSKIYRHCDIWTSGTDSGHEGEWKWETSYAQKPLTYKHWQRDEPNNGGGVENCLWMDWYFSWSWNDSKCNTDKACFICEKKLGSD